MQAHSQTGVDAMRSSDEYPARVLFVLPQEP